MKTPFIKSLGILAALLLAQTILFAESAPPKNTAIPFSEIGAKATADYKGDAIGITQTNDGAALHTGFQKLSGIVTREGLRLTSTENEGGSLRLVASALGRDTSTIRLPAFGNIMVSDQLVTFARPGLAEEYSVSADGVRQDFIIPERIGGAGDLRLHLSLKGAHAEPASNGVRLVLADSKRELAYSRLHVTDATGAVLTAKLEVDSPTRLSITVVDADAMYPLRIDPTFSDADWVSLNAGVPGADGAVSSILVDAGGNIYIGGSFSLVGNVAANNIAKWNGTSWSPLGTGTDRSVLALAMMGSDLYVGGDFYTAGGISAGNIAKWNGGAWSTVGNGYGVNGFSVRAFAVISSNLYVGGEFSDVDGVEDTRNIARWNGTTWSALGTGVDGPVMALAVHSGNLYAGGYFTEASGGWVNHIASWNGSAWSSLGTGIDGQVFALTVNNSILYAGGDFDTAGSEAVSNIAQWNISTGVWSGLGEGAQIYASGTVSALAVAGSDLYVGGFLGYHYIAKWNIPTGTWSLPGSGNGTNGPVAALATSGSTGLLVGGGFSSADGVAACGLVRWNTTTSTWTAFGSGMNATVYSLAVSGSNLFVCGDFIQVGGITANGVAKWNGSSWSALGSGITNTNGGLWLRALAVDGGGNLYVGGKFNLAGGVTAFNIAKWNGFSWSALGTGISGQDPSVSALAVDASGTLYAGGEFSSAGGIGANRIARWNGSSWSSLGTGVGGPAYAPSVQSLAVDQDGNLYAGGDFTTAGGFTVNRIAKWNAATSVWSSLGSGVNGSVRALLIRGADVYVAGSFTAAGSVTNLSKIAKYDITTGIWSGLGVGINGFSVNALAVHGTGLFVGGHFSGAGGISASNIARWDISDGSWSNLGSGVGIPNRGAGLGPGVYALATDSANHLFVGGEFSYAGTTVSPFITQANLPPPVLSDPEISIQQPISSDISNGGTRDFGDVALGGSRSLIFTILNIGTADLTLDGTPKVAVTGSPDFTVTAQPASPITGPSGSSDFTVRFTPTGSGLKTATLSIANNDNDERPFVIQLTGTALPSPPYLPISFHLSTAPTAVSLQFDIGFTVPGVVVGTPVLQNGAPHQISSEVLPDGKTRFIVSSPGNTTIPPTASIAVDLDLGTNIAQDGIMTISNVIALNSSGTSVFANPGAKPVVLNVTPPSLTKAVTGSQVPVGVEVIDLDGSITMLIYRLNGSPIGSTSVRPFTTTATSTTPGDFAFTTFFQDNAGNSGGSSPVTLRFIDPSALSTYSAFQSAWLDGAGSFTADPFNTGISNGLAWALGVNPRNPDRSRLPTQLIEENEGGKTFVYQARVLASGVVHQILTSTSLDANSWSPLPAAQIEETLEAGGWRLIEARLPITENDPARFIQLSVQNP